MRLFAASLLLALVPAFAQSTDRLSPEEIQAAVALKPNSGFVSIENMDLLTPSLCQVQMPSEDLFTPAGWINARAAIAKRQFLPYVPAPEDSERVIRVISRGCVNGTVSGPVCDSITRVVLLSDRQGTKKAEAVSETTKTESWHNGFGVSASCLSMVSKFAVADVQRVRNEKGEFLIATFSGPNLLKIYTVKQKHLKQLGF